MRIRSKIDWWMHGIFIIVTVGLLQLMVLYSVFAIVLGALFVLWVVLYFNTTYTLEEEELVCRYGFFSQRVKYYNLSNVQLVTHFSIAPAWSMQRIALTQRNKGHKKAVLEISPQNREFFFSELEAKIKAAK